MTIPNTMDERFMKRDSPTTKHIVKWVTPMRKLAMIVPLIFPRFPNTAIRLAMVM